MNTQGISPKKPRSLEEWKAFLNDHQISELKKLSDNPILLEALEKVLCYEIATEGVFEKNQPFDSTNNFVLSYVQAVGGVINNERLGEDVRGLFWGVHRLKDGLSMIKNFKQTEKVGENQNPAV